MTRLGWMALASLALVGCVPGDEFGGGDVGFLENDASSDSAAFSNGAPDDDSGLGSDPVACDVGSLTDDAELLLTPDVLAVHVVHSGLIGYDCSDWEIGGTAEAGAVTVTYADLAADTTECACTVWTLDYTVTNLAPGAWTLTAAGQSATATVEEGT